MERFVARYLARYAAIVLVAIGLGALPGEAKIIKTYRLQIGSVEDLQAAEALRQQAIARVPIPIFVAQLHGQYKVTAGDFATYQEAAAYKDRLYGEGFEGAFVVEVLASVSDQPAGPAIYKVQVGNFASLVNARQLQEELQARGVSVVSIERIEGFYKVRVGQYRAHQEALQALNVLREAGYPDAWVSESLASETLVERRVISMAPASPASITPPAAELRPESLGADRRLQVAVGPYTNLSLAEETLNDLSREGFGEVRLAPSGGIYLVEVGPPVSLLRADTLKRTLQDKGFLNVVLSERAVAGPAEVPAEVAVADGKPPEPDIPPEVAQRLEELQAEVERLRKAPSAESPQRMAQAHVKAAQRLMDLGHWEAARAQYQLALSNDPQNPEAIDGLSASLNAIREEERVKTESTVEGLLAAAQELLEQGKYGAARTQFKLVLEQDASNIKALEGLARAEEYLKSPPAATAAPMPSAVAQADAETAKQVEELLQKGKARIAQGHLLQAKNLLEQARKLEPDNALVEAGLEQVNLMISQQQAERRQQAPPRQQEATQQGTSWLGMLLWAVLILVVLGGGAAAVFFLVLRKRTPKQPEATATLQDKLKILGLKPTAKAGKGGKRAAAEPQAEPTSPFDDMPESLISSAEKPAPAKVPPVKATEPVEPTEPEPEWELEPVAALEPEPVLETEPQLEPEAEVEMGPEPEPVVEPEPVQEPTPPTPPLERAPAPELVFEQSYDQLQIGDEVETWKGDYESASLTVSQNRLIAGVHHYLKFVKEPCAEETLYCMLIPEAGRRPVFEFELCCLGVNEHSIALHLESVDNESVSIAMAFHTDPGSQEILFTVDKQSLEYASGVWRRLRCEFDLENNQYTVQVDGTAVITEASLSAPVKNIDMVSMKAQPEAEGTLLFNNFKIFATR